jgi:protein-S-isoprenylcysteine O-methyltransferase Ste14
MSEHTDTDPPKMTDSMGSETTTPPPSLFSYQGESQHTPGKTSSSDLGAQLYEWRHHTLGVFVVLVLTFSAPSPRSATLGTLLVVIGVLLRLYSGAFLGASTWSRNPLPSAEGLVQNGPYSFVRHPLYVANLLILAGFATYTNALWLILISIAGFAFQYHYIAAYEDSILEESLGEDFADYRRSVPAWIPARPIPLSDVEWPSTWTPAIIGEKTVLWAVCGLLTALLFLG